MPSPWRYIWGGLLPASWPPSIGHGGAGDERRLLRAQPQHDVGDLAGGADAAHRHGLAGEALRLGAGPFEVVGEDRPRRHDVDPDAAIGVVEGGDLGQPDDRRLGGDVRGEVGHRPHAGDRRHVDDRPAAAVEHRRDLVLHAEERATDVGADAAVELVGIDVGERRRHRPVGGVVERGVETAERVDGERHERAHRVVVTDVGGRGDRTAARRLDLAGDVTQRSGVAGAEHHGVTGGGEGLGGVGADASARTGDEGNLVRRCRGGGGHLDPPCTRHPQA